jgi:hypothetical protein
MRRDAARAATSRPARCPLTVAVVSRTAGGAGNLFNPVRTQTYSTVGLHLRPSDALHALAGRVGAFGDFDSDQYTDVFWIHDETREVSVRRWDHKTGGFDAAPAASVRLPDDLPSSLQLSVVPSDLNFDGNMDLLVVCADSDSGESELLLYFGGRRAAGQAGGEGSDQDTLHALAARPLIVGRAMGQVRYTVCSIHATRHRAVSVPARPYPSLRRRRLYTGHEQRCTPTTMLAPIQAVRR